MTADARERLIVALDVASVAEAEALVSRLGETVVFYKIGYQLAFAGGLPFADTLIRVGKKVFIDLKLHDIPETVERAVASAAALGVRYLTVHAAGGPKMLERAIGVIYAPRTERHSHYFHANLVKQFDAVIHIDESTAVRPLEMTAPFEVEEAETYPSGV